MAGSTGVHVMPLSPAGSKMRFCMCSSPYAAWFSWVTADFFAVRLYSSA